MKTVLFPRFSRGEKFGLCFLPILAVHLVRYHRESFQGVIMPNVSWEGVNGPGDDVEKHLTCLLGVNEDMQPEVRT